MKLRYYIKEGEKVYTLKETHNSKSTFEAHYKFIKFKEAEQKEQQ